MTIQEAKKQYFHVHKHIYEFIDCGVSKDGDGEFIKVWLMENHNMEIPTTYEGHRIKKEISGPFYAA
jgi:hypothetical protein